MYDHDLTGVPKIALRWFWARNRASGRPFVHAVTNVKRSMLIKQPSSWHRITHPPPSPTVLIFKHRSRKRWCPGKPKQSAEKRNVKLNPFKFIGSMKVQKKTEHIVVSKKGHYQIKIMIPTTSTCETRELLDKEVGCGKGPGKKQWWP